MALSILSYPNNTASVSSEMLFVVNEATKANDPVNYPDYKYIMDVYFESVLIARLKATPDPVNKFGVFDVSGLLRYYSPAYNFNPSNELPNYTDYAIADAYQVILGEEYSGSTYLNLLTDEDRLFFRSYAERPFTSSSVATTPGLLSNMPSEINNTGGVRCIVPYFTNVTGTAILEVSFKTNAGVTVGGWSIINDTMLVNHVRQIIVDNSIWQADYAQLSGLFDLRINFKCSKFDTYTLAWLNQYGAYESHSFGFVSKKQIEIEKKSYSQLPYKINASGIISYAQDNVFYGGKRDYNKLVKTQLSLTSDLLSAGEYTWLADMFKSPDVYLYSAAGWLPVRITGSNYDYRNYDNSRLSSLKFDVEFSDNYNSQYL